MTREIVRTSTLEFQQVTFVYVVPEIISLAGSLITEKSNMQDYRVLVRDEDCLRLGKPRVKLM